MTYSVENIKIDNQIILPITSSVLATDAFGFVYATSSASGSSGTSGVDGSSGTSGINGSSGTSGANGSSGTSGAAGVSGTSGTSFDWQGQWSILNEPYPINTVVEYNGSSYIAITGEGGGSDPASDAINWSLMAQAGTSGTSGNTGTSGTSGTSPSGGGTVSFVPTFHDMTIGNSTYNAYYQDTGGIVYVYFLIIWGSTSTRGANPRFDLPFKPSTLFVVRTRFWCDAGITCYTTEPTSLIGATQSNINGNSTNDEDLQMIWYFK